MLVLNTGMCNRLDKNYIIIGPPDNVSCGQAVMICSCDLTLHVLLCGITCDNNKILLVDV
jgi:hypothetical protein